MPFSIEAISECSLSVSCADTDQAQHIADTLRRQAVWRDVVAGIDSVAVLYDPMTITSSEAESMLRLCFDENPHSGLVGNGDEIVLRAHFGGQHGPDLEGVSRTLGIDPDTVVRCFLESSYKVAMIGFMPGFAYLSGLDERLRFDRKASPRLRVEPGSIGISGSFAGIYPLSSPGGWNLIGRVDHRSLVDWSTPQPFRLHPGCRVRFVDDGLTD